jgi:hypothetical protein
MTARQWVAHAGLDPRQLESGTSLHKPARISKKGNRHLRAALYMPALVAAREEPHVRGFYQRRIARGLKPLEALVAIERKLLHAIPLEAPTTSTRCTWPGTASTSSTSSWRAPRFQFLVIDARCRHVGPLRYGDRMRIHAWFRDLHRRIGIAYELWNPTLDRRAARSHTSLATLDREGTLLFETPEVVHRIRGPR